MDSNRLRGSLRQVVVFSLFVILLMGGYSAYKAFGQSIDDAQTDWAVVGSFLPRTDDLTMPSVFEIISGVFAEPRGLDEAFGSIVLTEAVFTLREAAVGFAVGVIVGLGIAIVLSSSQLLERALVPHVIASQTIPLIAIAPIVVIWGRKNMDFLPWEWPRLDVGIAHRHLSHLLPGRHQRPSRAALSIVGVPRAHGLLRSQSAPDALAATASGVAALPVLRFQDRRDGPVWWVRSSERSRRASPAAWAAEILLEAQRYTTGPERLYVAVLCAAALGIFVFLTISAVEYSLVRRKGTEAIL